MTLGSVAFCAIALAAGSMTLVINGKPAKLVPITHEGETYISLTELRRAGAQITQSGETMSIAFIPYQGGTQQVDALEGTTGEWIFNGIWRLRVNGATPIFDEGSNRPGWSIDAEIRNGSNKTVSMGQTGVSQEVLLFDVDGKRLSLDVGDFQVQMYFVELPPGGAIKHQLKFYYPSHTPRDAARPVSKLLLQVDTKSGLLRDTGLKYNVAAPNMRIWFRDQ